MQQQRTITLPQDIAFYRKEFEYDVTVDTSACGRFTAGPPGRPVTFDMTGDPVLMAALKANGASQTYKTTLERVIDSSMRFYRTGSNPTFSQSEFLDKKFMTAFDLGFCVTHTKGRSVVHTATDVRKVHGEEAMTVTELFGYGLAIYYVCQTFQIPPERFFFTLGSGARPDFHARVSLDELRAAQASVAAVTRGGTVLNLEVKAWSGWSSFRSNSSEGRDLLLNVYQKAQSLNRGSFLAVIASLPSPSNSKNPNGRCGVVVADPGTPITLSPQEQAAVMLRQLLASSLRIGLWPTCWRILSWVKSFDALTPGERALMGKLDSWRSSPQYRLVGESVQGRSYTGRYFSEAALLVGTHGNRGMQQAEAQRRLREGDFGWFWYAGLDVNLLDAIENRNMDALLRYDDGYSAQAKYASGVGEFYLSDQQPEARQLEEAAANILRLELVRW